MINPYWELLILLCLIHVIFAISLNLILGFNGQFSLGHAGFLAIGAYASGVVTTQLALATGGLQIWHLALGMALSVIISTILAAAIGYPCLRLRGDYLAIATLGFAEIIRIVLLALPKDVFGGPTGMRDVASVKNYFTAPLGADGASSLGLLNGLGNLVFTVLFSLLFIALVMWGAWALANALARGISRKLPWPHWRWAVLALLAAWAATAWRPLKVTLLDIFQYSEVVKRLRPEIALTTEKGRLMFEYSNVTLGSNQWLVFSLFVVLVTLVTWLVRNYLYSSPGRLAVSIREDEIAATNLGVNCTWMKLQNFMFACALAGLAGALTAHTVPLFKPMDFNFFKSVDVLLMVVLGGMGSVTGSFVGAFLITVLPEVLRFLGQWRLVIYSLVLIFFMLFRPGGLLGSAEIGALIRLRLTRQIDGPPVSRGAKRGGADA